MTNTTKILNNLKTSMIGIHIDEFLSYPVLGANKERCLNFECIAFSYWFFDIATKIMPETNIPSRTSS